jgi:hypothetical protein
MIFNESLALFMFIDEKSEDNLRYFLFFQSNHKNSGSCLDNLKTINMFENWKKY